MKIRCSSLSSFADCPRRAACSLIRDTIREHGYTLRVRPPSVGALVGTATHAVATTMLAAKSAGTEAPAGVTEIGIERYRDESRAGVQFDATTPATNDAHRQISIMSMVFASEILPRVSAGVAESYREGHVSGTPLTGHIDWLTVNRSLMDWKFGSVSRLHHGQLGGYSLLQRAAEAPVARLAIGWVPRVRAGKPQPSAVLAAYDIGLCERVAGSVISRMMADEAEYSRTQDPHAFLANTGSMMCSEKYCPAYGTDWCEETKGA